ncbi:MAG: motility protein A, partial [Brevinematales bacterium]
MELAWLIGLAGGGGFLVLSFFLGSGGNLLIYWDLMSLFTTVFGSLGSLLIATPMERFKLLPKIIGLTTKKVSIDPAATVETLVTFAEKARREGVLALEDDVAEIPDPFLKKAIQLVVDGTDPEVVKNIMFNELDQMEKRHAQGKKMLDDWAYFAPAFGMIGTLQGLIAMLKNMTDVASIGANMSTALITTLYGAIM